MAGKATSGQKGPNILIIWGDEIGWQNVSIHGLGTMGYVHRQGSRNEILHVPQRASR
jgi:hypothetical protein